MTDLPIHIDSTMITAFRGCPRKFYNEFVMGYRPSGLSIDLHAGACFSSAVEEVRKRVWKDGQSLDDALLYAQARFFQEWGDVEPPEWKRTAKTKDRVWEAVESYFQQYSPLTDHIRPYVKEDGGPTLEFTFAIPLDDVRFPLHPETNDPFLYCGRFDMVGEYQRRPVVVDDKTTGSSIGQRWAYQWNLRNQFLGYVWACRQRGIDTNTTVVRGIAIQMTQITHAEAIIHYSDYLINLWLNQLSYDLHRLVDCYAKNYWDYNLGDTCTSYGTCVFMDSCQSHNPDVWLQDMEIRHWNPVAKDPTNQPLDAMRTF